MTRTPKIGAEELARLAPGDQARELVFQLRDENPEPDEHCCRPWPFQPVSSNGALNRLKALGHAAVPALLEALDDDRPTRTVLQDSGWGGKRIFIGDQFATWPWMQRSRRSSGHALPNCARTQRVWRRG